MDWTAEPATETSMPPVALPGSRPSLPKLRVKLGGVHLSGGSSQAATIKPHATATTVPGWWIALSTFGTGYSDASVWKINISNDTCSSSSNSCQP